MNETATDKARLKALQTLLDGAIDEERVRSIVASELATRPNTVIEVRHPSGEVIKVEGGHAALRETVELLGFGFRCVFLSGPAGTGKTHLAREACRALGKEAHVLSLSGGISETAILGRRMPDGWAASPALQAWEAGHGLILDECDAADPNMLLVLNSMLETGTLNNPNSGREHKSGGGPILCCANTWGSGLADPVYVGRSPLDGAFLDRFAGARVSVDYDASLERSLWGARDEAWLAWYQAARKRLSDAKLQVVWSMRGLLAAAMFFDAGRDLNYVRLRLVVGLPSKAREVVMA